MKLKARGQQYSLNLSQSFSVLGRGEGKYSSSWKLTFAKVLRPPASFFGAIFLGAHVAYELISTTNHRRFSLLALTYVEQFPAQFLWRGWQPVILGTDYSHVLDDLFVPGLHGIYNEPAHRVGYYRRARRVYAAASEQIVRTYKMRESTYESVRKKPACRLRRR